jgi:hypothetical protein
MGHGRLWLFKDWWFGFQQISGSMILPGIGFTLFVWFPEYGFSDIGSDTNVYHPKSPGNCCNALNFNEGKYLEQCANVQMCKCENVEIRECGNVKQSIANHCYSIFLAWVINVPGINIFNGGADGGA